MKARFLVILALAMTGCCSQMPADLMFEVEGVTPPKTECDLSLLVEGKPASLIEPVSGEFHTVFYVSFCEREYTVQAVCRGRVVYAKKVVFPNEKTKQPYNIGKLELRQNRNGSKPEQRHQRGQPKASLLVAPLLAAGYGER